MHAFGDLAGKSEDEVKAHLAQEYSGEYAWFSQRSTAPATPEALAIELASCEILIAYELQEYYEAASWFLFRRAGKLFEVEASHCSCYGFEGQWTPEEVTKEALLKRNLSWFAGEDDHETVLARILEL